MSTRFVVGANLNLDLDAIGYYHQIYSGWQTPGNPDFINYLKNTFNNEPMGILESARDRVVAILKEDLPEIITEHNMSDCVLICVPRAKTISNYSNSQLMFSEAIKLVANSIPGVIDGTDRIIRISDTRTTHLRKSEHAGDGPTPYPGITMDTCEIDGDRITNQNIILIDDIYTKNVNIDEDCIHALRQFGAKTVIFYSIGYTKRT